MKIRRALTAAAAAAVLAPAAVLAAPAAAFATAPVTEAGPRTPTAPDSPDAARPADRPADSATSGGGTTTPDEPRRPGDAAAGGSASLDRDGPTRPAPGQQPKAAGSAGGTAEGAAGGGKDAGDADGAGQSCAFESDQLQVAVHGLPRELAAGGAWTSFSMTLTNTTGTRLAEVQPFLLVSSAEDVDRPYWELETEYHDAKTGKWKTFHDATPDELFGSFAVGPRSTLTLQLRTHVVKDAKPGAGYALAAGDYRNRDGSCGSAKEAWYDFTILPANAKPTQPPTSKPTEPGKPGGTAEPSRSAAPGGAADGSDSTGGLRAQGGAHLAATGSSSALPVIALAGGAAMVIGAGAVVGARRRKGVAGPNATDATA
ncbi:LPXTG cell wall anchor domain-containing protein [Streptomyces lunalinharesii]|uniref:LPXTG cell wall anchor domain-containing protein n=1 Tax=Streptomyces lunalinharesii TaxID=333384 RepID=A0ABP6E9W1_9ACTN